MSLAMHPVVTVTDGLVDAVTVTDGLVDVVTVTDGLVGRQLDHNYV